MKILMHGDGSIVYGAERQAVLIAQGLMRRGHQVVFSCPPGTPFHELLEASAIPTVHVRPRGNLDLWSALRFSAWVRAERPDAVLLTSWKRALSVGWAARRAGRQRIVFRVGGTKPPGTRTGEWRVRRAVRACTDALIATSPAVDHYLRRQFPFFHEAERHVVWNAVTPVQGDATVLRRQLRIGQAPLVLAVGGLSPNKSHHVLLDSFARLGDSAAHLAIAGSGSQEESLRRQTAELQLEQRVHWLGHRNDAENLYAAADLFVLTSRHEGTPSALLEAMSAGLPVISTPVAGTEITVAQAGGRPDAGWIVPYGDADALARRIGAVLAGKFDADVQAHAAEARWRAQHWFGVERMVAGYEAVLRGGVHYDDGVGTAANAYERALR